MKAEKLKECLRERAMELRQVVTTLNATTSLSLHSDCVNEFNQFDKMADILTSTCELIDAREYARKILDRLPSITDASTDLVDYHGITIPFSTARLLGFQSYLSTTWAVCNSIISGISVLLFNEKIGRNRQSPPNLLTQLVKGEATAHYNSFFLLKSYGWPIAVSYVIRNHFVHDGASCCGHDFFAGRGKADKYQISLARQGGWSFLEEQMNQKHRDVKQDYTRRTETWPWHQDNLLKLLELCNDEIDEAVTCLIGWSVGMATLQARYLLGRDSSLISSPPTSS